MADFETHPVGTAKRIVLLEAVAADVQKFLNDVSWRQHLINLHATIAKLEAHDEDN